ncbi:MAG: aminoglycoside N(3)-acetyltransferase [Anaerolineae bacterium]
MSEADAVDRASFARTRKSLAADLRRLGAAEGMTLLVHSSLSSLGWVNGGPMIVIQALMDVLTTAGTLVMPTHTGEYSDPAEWSNPPVPPVWYQAIRDTMPLFDPRLTPTRGMGRIPELFRTWPGVRRSCHPQVSFAAWGKEAAFVTADHELSYSLGEGSPLARLYDLGGYVLLLGVGYDSNTSFHLSECRAGVRPQVCKPMPVREEGRTIWERIPDIEYDADPFPAIGAELDQTGDVTIGQVGSATCRLYPQVNGVDFAVQWLKARQER